ncbi:hypothetical protein M0R45_001448 [Rubus argutus]|uniref:RPW8 domain-containing protein n=1 Tax=Rubus argutus TaxID=59490 RepID=A0AAW1VKT2_RUBAR
MADLVAGAAIGLPFTALYEVIKEVVVKTTMFKPLLEDLEKKMDSLKPLIDEIDKYNKVLDRKEKELRDFKLQMENGASLIPKCSKVRWWHICKKYKYTNQLVGLESSLQSLYNILNVQAARDVKETLVEVKDIRTDVHRIAENFGVHNQKTDLVHGWGAVPVGAPFTVGVDEPLRELKIKLLKDEKVSMLVITAIGGCGKTTLAIKFCEDCEVKDKFKDNIFFVTVSKKSDGLVVQELYQRMGSNIPILQSKVDVDKWLQKFLIGVGKNPVLFVLDDVWPESESLLQKFDDFKLPNSKILVTSRFQFPRFGTQLCLKALNVEDAMTLFKHSASLGDRSSYVSEDIIREIVEHFKESPLAITVVGRSLCGKSAESWLKRASALKGASILNSEAALIDGLQSSLDALNEEDPILKECFLDLGSFPQDRRIPAAALIDMWAELYKLKDFESIANLHELSTRSLANLLIIR